VAPHYAILPYVQRQRLAKRESCVDADTAKQLTQKDEKPDKSCWVPSRGRGCCGWETRVHDANWYYVEMAANNRLKQQ
jgi:hypothetical protein